MKKRMKKENWEEKSKIKKVEIKKDKKNVKL